MSEKREPAKNSKIRDLSICSTVWHCLLYGTFFTALFLPWHESANYFETYFVIFPDIIFWDIWASIASFLFLLILLALISLSILFHVEAIFSKNDSQARKKLKWGILSFLWSALFFFIFAFIRPWLVSGVLGGIGDTIVFCLSIFTVIIIAPLELIISAVRMK